MNGPELANAMATIGTRLQVAGELVDASTVRNGIGEALSAIAAVKAGPRTGHTARTLRGAAAAAHARIVARAAERAASSPPIAKRTQQKHVAHSMSARGRHALVGRLRAAGFLQEQNPTDAQVLAAVDDMLEYSKYKKKPSPSTADPAVDAEYAKYYTSRT